jgi:urease accessory protein
VVAVPDGRGGTRLDRAYGEAPLLVRETGPGRVHLVGGAAGPLGGDELRVDLEVAAGARLVVRTVAASLVLPGRGRSHLHVTAVVAGQLHWQPEPIVAVRGCDHLAESTVELSATATLYWQEELVCGRHGEQGGDLVLTTTVRRDGRPLYRQDLAVGPGTPGACGPAVLGSGRTAGSVIEVDPRYAQRPALPRVCPGGALMPLAGPGYVATAVADHAHDLRRALAKLTAGG